MMNHVNGAIREGWYWRVDDDKDTFLSIFNSGETSTTAKVSLDFRSDLGMESYDLGQRVIPAHGTNIIDIGAIAAAGLPDASGTVLPRNAEGGYRVEGTASPRGNVMTEALVFDRKRKTFETYYNTCCNTTIYHTPSSLSGPVGGTGHMYVSEYNSCTGSTTDVTASATYSSFNSAIASAYPGGLVNYNSPGSTTLRSSYYYQHWFRIQQECLNEGSIGDRPTDVLRLAVQGNSFIFVGTDPAFASVNKYFATVAQPSGGTFSATSSNAGDTFTSGSIGGTPWVSVKTTAQSIGSGDRTLTFTYKLSDGSQTSQTVPVTARQFAYATNGSLTNTCSLGFGYLYDIVYTPYTHPDHAAAQPGIGLDGTSATEVITPPTAACANKSGPGTLDANSQFTDVIAVCSTAPIPTCSSTHTQVLSVGGYTVRTNSLTISNTALTYLNQGPTQ